MTEFLFGRHAESSHNLEQPHLICGRNNHIPLTPYGEQQARDLGAYLQQTNYVPDMIFSSGAVRADTTARLASLTAGYDMAITPDARLLEVSQGPYEGRPRDKVYSPEVVAAYNLTTLHGKLPGTESILDTQLRMLGFLDETHAAHPGSKILVFSHGLAIRSLVGKICGHTKPQILAAATPNASLTSIVITGTGPVVQYVGKNVISE